MPGSQTVPLRGYGGDKYGLTITAKPTTFWRHIPGIGMAWTFRLGAKVKFELEVKCTSISELEGEAERLWTEHERESQRQGKPVEYVVQLVSIMGDEKKKREDRIYFPAPKKTGECWKRTLPALFLEASGDGSLRVVPVHGGWDTLYTYNVQELAYPTLNWVMAFVASLIGGAIGAILAWLLRPHN